jgi:hypothetical protein
MKALSTFAAILLLSCGIFAQQLDRQKQQEAWNKRIYSIEDFLNKFNGIIDLNNEVIADSAASMNRRIESILYLINDEEQALYEDSLRAFIGMAIGEEGKNKLNLSDEDCYAEVTFNSSHRGQAELIRAYLRFVTSNDKLQYWSLESMISKSFGHSYFQGKKPHFPPNSHGNDFASIKPQLEAKISSGDIPVASQLIKHLRSGDLEIAQVVDVNYLFFQVKDWFFIVNEFHREGRLSGWLMSDIKYIPENDKEAEMKIIMSDIPF